MNNIERSIDWLVVRHVGVRRQRASRTRSAVISRLLMPSRPPGGPAGRPVRVEVVIEDPVPVCPKRLSRTGSAQQASGTSAARARASTAAALNLIVVLRPSVAGVCSLVVPASSGLVSAASPQRPM